MKIFDRERFGMWKLKPCPCCGGDARVEICKDSSTCYAVCLECGLRTGAQPSYFPETAREVWEKRCTEHAQVLTLDKLFESVYGYEDCDGYAAAWMETKDSREIKAVIVSVGLDICAEWTIYLRGMNDAEIQELPRDFIDQYGKTWRLWDKKPTDDNRRNTPWEQ